MKKKIVFVFSVIIMIMALLLMGIDMIISSFPDSAIRIIGYTIIVDLVILTYSFVTIHKRD
jgi:hypothetical protein